MRTSRNFIFLLIIFFAFSEVKAQQSAFRFPEWHADFSVEFPGREYIIKSGTSKGKAQVFITGTRMLIILALDPSGDEAGRNVDKFFRSLRISLK